MARKSKYNDAKSAGKSKLVPFKEGEEASQRHERRLSFNLNSKEKIEEWCKEQKIKLKISNYGHHWSFKKNDDTVYWWPSSAKLVINEKWTKGIHVHDYEQAIKQLIKVFGEENENE